MDCDTARTLLAVRRPVGRPEFGPDDLAALDRHLAGCPACATLAARHEAFDAAVAGVMTAVPVPAGLRAGLVAQASARRRKAWRRRAYWAIGAAAAVLLTTVGGYFGKRATRPAFDAEALAIGLGREADAPGPAVRDWLRAEKLPDTLPLDVDYRHHVAHGLERIDRWYAPVVVFRVQPPGQPAGTLKVYLLRDETFRLNGVANALASRYTAQVLLDDRSANGVVFLAVFDTPTLDPFLRRGTPLN